MALTNIQRDVCQLIAQNRIEGGESYVAGGAALNTVLDAPRLSRDVDLFHDTEAALQQTWDDDRTLLGVHGYRIEVIRERPAFVHAVAHRGGEAVALEWVRDSAFRFFPLVSHPILGLTMHPFDLATNKMLALVGRVEVRDWIDTIACHEQVQSLGYLAWAACGKDPGYSPLAILAASARSTRYRQAEVDQLDFAGPVPDVAELSRAWRLALEQAHLLVAALPAEHAGKALLGPDLRLVTFDVEPLKRQLADGSVRFHEGSIRGAFPSLR